MKIEFDVKINANILYDYLLRHNYMSMQGLLGTLVGALLVVAFLMNHELIIYLIMGIVLMIYLPAALFLRAHKQALLPVFKKPLHYCMSDEGVCVSQGEESQMQLWDTMYKAVSTRTSIILYTSRFNASIFPRRDLGDLEPEVIKVISTHMNPKRVKIKY